jgi:hypothetical protein
MYVTDITISGTEYHPGETMMVDARIQKDAWDLGDYALSLYIKKKTDSAYAWERICAANGSIGILGGNYTVDMPSFTVPSKPGEYYVGVLDDGNVGTDRGATVDAVLRSTNALRLFAVTTPPPVGKAQLNIYAYPSDATIYIDGEKIGTGSVIGRNVDPGIYQIAAKKFLYEDAATIVTVGMGEVVPVELTLNPIIDTGDITTLALYAGAGLLLAGTAYVLVNKKARAKATEYGRTAWDKSKKAYGKAGELYVKVRDA